MPVAADEDSVTNIAGIKIKLTKQEIITLRQIFKLFDKDDSGHITIKELHEVSKKLNMEITA